MILLPGLGCGFGLGWVGLGLSFEPGKMYIFAGWYGGHHFSV
jgi:hypothetical protein